MSQSSVLSGFYHPAFKGQVTTNKNMYFMKKFLAIFSLAFVVSCSAPNRPSLNSSSDNSAVSFEVSAEKKQLVLKEIKERVKAFMVESPDNGFPELLAALKQEEESLALSREFNKISLAEGLDELKASFKSHPEFLENLEPIRKHLGTALKRPVFYLSLIHI